MYSNWSASLQYDDYSIREVSGVKRKKGNTFTPNLHLPALKMVNFTKPASGAQLPLTLWVIPLVSRNYNVLLLFELELHKDASWQR